MKTKAARLIRSGQIIGALSVAAVLLWATYEGVVYFRTAPRFEVKQLSVLGLKRVRQNQVLAKAGFAMGTNVFCVDLDEMRSRVEELEWVRYAAVQRVLPDEIIIKIVERDPIGLTRIRGETYLFDIDGKILDPDSASGSSFPVLDALRLNDKAGNRHKVQTYRKVMDEVGETSLSEIHINDAGEVTIVSASDPVAINLGITDFHNRWIKYLQLKPQIQQRYPQALRVDLRFKNQVIIKMKDDEAGEKIVWGKKKDTL
jgi:cell division septal protein FtsQ